MANPLSVLYVNVDQGMNKFSKYPRASTCYCVFSEKKIKNRVEIWTPGHVQVRTLQLSPEKVALLKEHTTHLPGSFVHGYDERVRKVHKKKKPAPEARAGTFLISTLAKC
jgi:hypothetical protein